MRRFFILLAVAACALSAVAQNRTAAGAWNGGISTPGVELSVIVNLQQKEDHSWTGTIDIPMPSCERPGADRHRRRRKISFLFNYWRSGKSYFQGNARR